jgi:hypothetical protein
MERMMHRQILASSAAVVTLSALTMATATIWLLLTAPAETVVTLSHGDVGALLEAVFGVISSSIWALLQYL